MPALPAKTQRLVVANTRHSPSYGCVLRLDPMRFAAPFGHGRKTLSLYIKNHSWQRLSRLHWSQK
jgi:hypothetical protein